MAKVEGVNCRAAVPAFNLRTGRVRTRRDQGLRGLPAAGNYRQARETVSIYYPTREERLREKAPT